MGRRQSVCVWMLLVILVLGWATSTAGQGVNTATLSGTVFDQQNLPVRGAKVTLTNTGNGAIRTASTGDNGRYDLVGVPPGQYKLTVDGGGGFAIYENPAVVLTVGEAATLDAQLQLRTKTETITVNSEPPLVETQKTDVSSTIDSRKISNLPIDGRNYINFTLLIPQAGRDETPSIGAAPTSGLNFGGQRARSNGVSVDGADAVDNSINGVRATVSQEAVQEFQLILGDYNAEYGRATGGVVNIVTKGGGNDLHGDIFGYLRNKSFQARNAFSGQVDPTTGELIPTKQAFTRVQAGLTFGGPIVKDKTFYFFSYEDTLREETGFSSIGEAQGGGGPWGMVPVTLPTAAGPLEVQLTPSQAGSGSARLTSGIPAHQTLGVQYGVLLGSASSVALNKLDFGAIAPVLSGGTLNPGPGAQFPVPVSCPSGATVNGVVCGGFAGIGPGGSIVPAGVVPLPTSYKGLNA